MRTLTCAGLGFLARVLVMSHFKEPLRQRVEITTPINSWKRAFEGVHLLNSGLDPYSGDILHEYPISLQSYKIIVDYFNVDLAFAFVDVMTAILLQYSVFNQMSLTNPDKIDQAKSQSFKVLLIYLFSPITILSCAGTPTSTFTNLLISIINFIVPIKSFRVLTCVLCAFLACNNIHFSTLVLPIFLCLEYCKSKIIINNNNKKVVGEQSIGITSNRNQDDEKNTIDSSNYYEKPEFYSSLSVSAIIFLSTVITLLLTSYLLMGNSWTFLKSTYLFVLKIQDQTPNIGMFWYFFTEMFENFLDFFVWIVQINSFIHVIPLSLTLKHEPFFLVYIIILVSTISQPYPSLSSIGLISSLLPQWSKLYTHMKKGLIVICTSVVCMSLWPVFWHLWIILGSANSNFYFGATLAFTASLILFLTDILHAHHRFDAKKRFGHLKKD